MPSRLGRYPDDVDIVFDRFGRRLLRGLKQRADIDVETYVGKCRGDDLGAAVVAVLAELANQDARPSSLALGETRDCRLNLLEALIVGEGAAVDPGDAAGGGAVAAEFDLHRIGYLADRRPRSDRLDR